MSDFCGKSDVLENVAIQVAIRNLLGLRFIDILTIVQLKVIESQLLRKHIPFT